MTLASLPVEEREPHFAWNPHRLVSLWDIMIEFHCDRIATAVRGLCQLLRSADTNWFDEEKDPPLADSPSIYLKTQMQGIFFAAQTNSLGLPHSQRQAAEVIREIDVGLPISSVDVRRIASQLLSTLETELKGLKFASIPEDGVRFFQQDKLFGEAVYKRFPSAHQDVIDAGNCIALGIHNAAAYQLIRIAELGLRVLARFCNIQQTSVPIDYLDWGNLIQRIDATLVGPANTTITHKRKVAVEFCKKAVADATLIKDAWRNEIAHNRTDYKDYEVQAIYGQVNAFMRLLASELSESGWRKIPIT